MDDLGTPPRRPLQWRLAMSNDADLLLILLYGVVGFALTTVYCAVPRLRREPSIHVLTLLCTAIMATLPFLGQTEPDPSLLAFHMGTRFFLFLSASLLYVPVLVYLTLRYGERLLEHLTSQRSASEERKRVGTEEEQWQQVQRLHEAAALDPTAPGAHEQLGDLYLQMGFFDSAAFQYRKAADWTPKGYGQARLLYKTAVILVEKQKDARRALGLLRRIVRVYPKSYFAAYSRRIIGHYEAHNQASERGQEPVSE